MRYQRLIFLVWGCLYGCEVSEEPFVDIEYGESKDNSLSSIEREIFEMRCLPCHRGPGGLQGVALSAGFAYDSLVEEDAFSAPMKLVTPYSVEESYLIYKLEGTHLEVGGGGGRMPPGAGTSDAPSVPSDEMLRIKTWIVDGAKDN